MGGFHDPSDSRCRLDDLLLILGPVGRLLLLILYLLLCSIGNGDEIIFSGWMGGGILIHTIGWCLLGLESLWWGCSCSIGDDLSSIGLLRVNGGRPRVPS